MIAKDLPLEIAYKEYRLNIANQYSETLAFLVCDIPIMMLTNEITMETLRTVFKDD